MWRVRVRMRAGIRGVYMHGWIGIRRPPRLQGRVGFGGPASRGLKMASGRGSVMKWSAGRICACTCVCVCAEGWGAVKRRSCRAMRAVGHGAAGGGRGGGGGQGSPQQAGRQAGHKAGAGLVALGCCRHQRGITLPLPSPAPHQAMPPPPHTHHGYPNPHTTPRPQPRLLLPCSTAHTATQQAGMHHRRRSSSNNNTAPQAAAPPPPCSLT